MTNVFEYEFTQTEIALVAAFAKQNMAARRDRSGKRTVEERFRHLVIGALGELTVIRVLQKMGFTVLSGFGISQDSKGGDGGCDLTVKGVMGDVKIIQVKASTTNHRLRLREVDYDKTTGQYRFNSKQRPDVFVFVKVHPLLKTGTIEFAVAADEFWNSCKTVDNYYEFDSSMLANKLMTIDSLL